MNNIPKIRGYLATQKNRALFLYRRNHKNTYLISFNYQKNKESILVGSRFYGKIYPNRCDLSPDGTYFLYFAMGKSQKHYEKKLYCWTGICKPPDIKVHILLAHGDTWGGGGRFVDDETIFVSPGMHPDFDIKQKYQFDKYKITFKGEIEDGGWTSGKGWKLSEEKIYEGNGYNYAIPKCWTKTHGKTILFRYLNYNSYLKSKNGQTPGSYDVHGYEVQEDKNKVKHSLDDKENICLWADFDNFGRLIVARKSKIYIYQSFKDTIEKSPYKTFNFEEWIDND